MIVTGLEGHIVVRRLKFGESGRTLLSCYGRVVQSGESFSSLYDSFCEVLVTIY